MRKNLLKEMIEVGVTERELADFIKVTPRTVKNKISGQYDFALSEVIGIRDHFFKNRKIEYLFKDFPN